MQNPPVFNATDAAIFLFPGKKIRHSLMGRSQKALFYGIFTLAPNGYLHATAFSHTVALVSVQRLIPTTLARILETSAGV